MCTLHCTLISFLCLLPDACIHICCSAPDSVGTLLFLSHLHVLSSNAAACIAGIPACRHPALTRLLFTNTALWIYGGFIRDAIIRGEVHDQMDLDVGIPLTGMGVDQGMSQVSAQAKSLGMQFVRNGASRDARLRSCMFTTADGSSDFEVQVSARLSPVLFHFKTWFPLPCMMNVLPNRCQRNMSSESSTSCASLADMCLTVTLLLGINLLSAAQHSDTFSISNVM